MNLTSKTLLKKLKSKWRKKRRIRSLWNRWFKSRRNKWKNKIYISKW
jgi:predicted restriction endonuclease